MNDHRAHRHRKTFLSFLTALLLLIGGLAAGYRLASSVRSPEQIAANAAPPPRSLVTAAVTNKDLTTEVRQFASVIPGTGVSLPPPAGAISASSVVTHVAVAVGGSLTEGDLIADISGQPLVAAALPFPMYRDLVVGDMGPDVVQLAEFLKRQGHLTKEYTSISPADETLVRASSEFWTKRGYPLLVTVPSNQPQSLITKLKANSNSITLGSNNPANAPGSMFANTGETAPVEETLPATVAKGSWFLRVSPGQHLINSVGVMTGSTLVDPDAPVLVVDVSASTVASRVDHAAALMMRPGMHGRLLAGGDSGEIPITVTLVSLESSNDAQTGVPGYLITANFDSEPSLDLADQPELIASFDISVSAGVAPTVPVTSIFTEPAGSSHIEKLKLDGSVVSVPIDIGQCLDGWCTFNSRGGEPLVEGDKLVVSWSNQ